MDHINLEKILSYGDKRLGNRENRKVEEHLATCERCHELFVGLKSVGNAMSMSFREETASVSCPEDWEMAALVKKELPSQAADRIKIHLKDCSFCIDTAAGYYKALNAESLTFETPESWKQKAVKNIESGHPAGEPEISFIQRILSFFPRITSPFPVAAGLVAALLAIAVVAWVIVPGKDVLQAVASNETLLMRDSEVPSSLGFSGADDLREVSKMDIALNGKEIIFAWKPIEGAAEYNFTLKNGNLSVYDTKAGSDALVALSKDMIETHTTYKWLITGKTADDRYFEYRGNFVLVK